MTTMPEPAELVHDVAMGSVRPLPAGTVTLLMTDLEGSTRLWEGDPEIAKVALARHHELLADAVERHGGARPLEQGEGDSVVAAFATPSDALTAALELQRAFAAEEWPTEQPLRVRVGLHTGEVTLRGDENYQGRTIIRCARLRNAAHGGQTVLSSATVDLIQDRLPADVTVRDLGSHRLKDLGRPERVWQLCHPELADAFPPLATLDAFPNNLPAQLTTLIGREDELADVRSLLEGNRLVTLTGAGGSGKTRLALQAAADTPEHHPGGVWWVELAPVRDDRLVGTAVLEAMGLQEDHDETVVETLTEHLRGAPVLIVVDNCEHVVEGVTALVHPLLEAAPSVRVLTTSREPLGITGEVTWRVPSLGDDAATALFVERAGQARAGFAPDRAQRAEITTICRRLDGLPLAIELAAARTRMMSPARISAGLEDRFRLLSGGNRNALPRQQTLEASVAWSHDLLTPAERTVLRRLSVFAGAFTLEAAEAVAADGDDIDEFAVLDLLAALVDRSLVQAEDDPTDTRYRLLETIRQFARERLVETGETDACRTRHLAHFLTLAEDTAPQLVEADGPAALARLEAEHDNLRAALAWAETLAPSDEFGRLAVALTIFWELRGHIAEGRRWFDRVLTIDAPPSAVRARTLWGAAHMAVYSDDWNTAPQLARAAVGVAETAGDTWSLARALNTLGYATAMFDPIGARAPLDRSIALGNELGDPWVVADGLKMLTIAHVFASDLDALRRDGEELRRVAEDLRNLFFVAWADAVDGYGALRRGEIDRAEASLRAAIASCRAVGDPATGGIARDWLAEVQAHAGRVVEARRLVEDVINYGKAGGHVAVPFATLEMLRLMTGTGDAAGSHFLAGCLRYEQPMAEAWARWLEGAAAKVLGDLEAARAALAAARAANAAAPNAWVAGRIDTECGLVARADQRPTEAEQHLHTALGSQWEDGLVPDILVTLEALAGVAIDLESAAEAARLLGGVDAARSELGIVALPVHAATVAADRDRAEAALGPDEFATLCAEGAATGLADLVAYATRARGERKRPSAGWESLTPTEEQVVALVAEGLTNPQIGERMFIARGTVKVHLSHIFAKLGVATRAELAAAVTRRDLRATQD